jgi:hypothetical protein
MKVIPLEFSAPTTAAIADKIVEGLKAEETVQGSIFFSFFLARVLSQSDFDHLEHLENYYGVDICNDWLASVLEKSGRYAIDNGNVIPLNA